jgi:hypothetical protein
VELTGVAGGDEFLGGGATDVRRVGAALMFVGAGTNVYDAFSAVMSSPWSTEKFTDDPEAERMAREYVRHAMVISGAYALVGAWLSRSVWPIIGALGVGGYMWWLYNRALCRSQAPEGMSLAGGQNGNAPPNGAAPAGGVSYSEVFWNPQSGA